MLRHIGRRFASTSSLSRSVDAREARKFAAVDWAGDEGSALRKMHATRFAALRCFLDASPRLFARRGAADEALPLQGLRFADIGSGGGLLSASLVSQGASVIAIDPVASNAAATEAKVLLEVDSDLAAVNFEARACSVEELLVQEGPHSFDAVVSLEVLEHVADRDGFVASCAELAAGALVFSTINRTLKAYMLAIVAAEHIAGMVPPGTHDWFKFVQPREIEKVVHEKGMHTDEVVGLVFNPVTTQWFTSNFETSVNFMYFATR